MLENHVTGSHLYPVSQHAHTQNDHFDWGDPKDPCTDIGSDRKGKPHTELLFN